MDLKISDTTKSINPTTYHVMFLTYEKVPEVIMSCSYSIEVDLYLLESL